MELLSCANCGHRQPRDWRTGDLCIHCGVLARSELRCPWCRRWSPGQFCRHCGCDLPPGADFGAARMLVDAGVDRLSLGARLRALDPGQKETLAARFAQQRGQLLRRVDEARFCEQHLAQKGFAAELEEQLVGQLPLSPDSEWLQAGPAQSPSGEPTLEWLAEHSPLPPIQELATIALVRRGAGTRDTIYRVQSLSSYERGPLAVEAALALGGWRARELGWLEERRNSDRPTLEQILGTALEVPDLRAEAAVAIALGLMLRLERGSTKGAAEDALAALRPALVEALDSPDADVRFGAALALRDEERLRQASEGTDAAMRVRALRALARSGAGLLARRLREGTDPDRLTILRSLRAPLDSGLLEAALHATAVGSEEVRRVAIGRVRETPFVQLPPQDRAQVGQWLLAQPAVLPADQVQDFLAWATTATEEAPPVTDAELRPFVAAATHALAAASTEDRLRQLQDSAFERWVLLAGPQEHALLDALAADEATAERLFAGVLLAHARHNGYQQPPDRRALDVLLGLWERAGAGRSRWTGSLRSALRSHSGLSARELWIDAFWERFRKHPGERAQIVDALDAWRRELFERRDAEGPDRALHGTDPLRYFEIYAEADPGELCEVLLKALDLGGAEALLPLTSAGLAEIARRQHAHPKTALLALAKLSGRICNAFREEATEATRTAVAQLRTAWSSFEPALATAAPSSREEEDFGYLRSHVTDELEIIASCERDRAEREAERQERLERDQRRAQEQQERAAAAERERQVRDEEQTRARAAHAALAAQQAAWTPPPPPPTPTIGPLEPAPTVERKPVDAESLGPPPLPTLVDYVRFMKRMSAGVDVMRLFAFHGLDATSWSVCVNGWARVMQTRMDAAMRFGELMQAPWG